MKRKNYPCSCCDQRFTRSDNLVRHEKCHHQNHYETGTDASVEAKRPRLNLDESETRSGTVSVADSPAESVVESETETETQPGDESDDESYDESDEESKVSDDELDDEAFETIIGFLPRTKSASKFRNAFRNRYKDFHYILHSMEKSPLHLEIRYQVEQYVKKEKTLSRAIDLAVKDHDEKLMDVLERYENGDEEETDDEDGDVDREEETEEEQGEEDQEQEEVEEDVEMDNDTKLKIRKLRDRAKLQQKKWNNLNM